ncbi:MAG: MerR family transcriptional regulator [Oscillospiraceae bacterium]|nr:MerR family transcriptional regulator [Oscillospiraceae bacterium]
MSKYTTGEMAKLCNVTVRTVQFYDTKGLLHPSDLTEGGRRLYTDGDLTKLRLICTLKAIGLSLNLICGILESELPGKVLSLLLDEQARQIGDEIKERQSQLDIIKVIKGHIGDMTTIPENSIIDIENMMEKNKKVRKKFRSLLVKACIISIPQYSALVWWIVGGPWLPFVLCFLLTIPVGVLLAKQHFKDSAFICAECNSVFKPPFGKVINTSGTQKARWLTCEKCGHAGYCVETISDGASASMER